MQNSSFLAPGQIHHLTPYERSASLAPQVLVRAAPLVPAIMRSERERERERERSIKRQHVYTIGERSIKRRHVYAKQAARPQHTGSRLELRLQLGCAQLQVVALLGVLLLAAIITSSSSDFVNRSSLSLPFCQCFPPLGFSSRSVVHCKSKISSF